jgi:type VI secretion system secreted protein VgrG
MSVTQQNRIMSISTPLGEDELLLNKLSAAESLSELFSFEVELLRPEEKPPVKVENILGQNVGILVKQNDGTTRYFSGLVGKFALGSRDERFLYYYATIVPNVWVLTQKSQSRIFQHLSVPDILKKVFAGFSVTYELQGAFEKRNYCVQYRETDFDFASRLMEEEGIYYYFEHTEDGHKMIVANTPQSHKDCPSKAKIAYSLDVSSKEYFISSIDQWHVEYQVQSGKVTLWDSHFELPNKKLEAEKPLRTDIKPQTMKDFEVYDYPGGYAKRFDGIDKGGGDEPANLQKVFSDNSRTAGIRMQEIDAQYQVANGLSDCCSLTAGHRFELEAHPISEFNAKHTLVSVTHDVEQSPHYVSDEEISAPYRNSFRCVPNSVPFRPPRATPKPILHGSQTAVVVGPAGEEIFTDKYGRVKVQFRWDREGKNNPDSSCWIRVSQAWAGKQWGTMFIPRIGMEVVVEFLEGDPDQPIITGCVYNAETMPPYKLPDEKTKATIKTYSSKGGGGFNELRFEDKKGSEQIFIHAEKDIDERVKKDSREWIGNERHLIVVKDKLEKVGGDKHLELLGDKNEKVAGTVSLNVQQDIQEKAGKNYALDAGMEIHLKSGMNLTLETGANLTLKVGGNFININSGGIFIKGTMVMINSGGAAGSGSGSKPEKPKAPRDADKAEPGQKIPPPPPPPPAPVFSYSPAAMVMKNAAKTGVPFCEICQK